MSAAPPIAIRPYSPLVRCRVLGWVAGFALAIFALVACDRDVIRCESGACPVGFQCEAATGQCQPTNLAAAQQTALFGSLAAVGGTQAAPAVVGFASDRQSLAVLEDQQVAWLAGPAANPGEPPAGQVSAVTRGSDGQLHVAWLRASDGTLWYGHGRGKGTWQRQQVSQVAAGAAVRPLAIAMSMGQPVIAFRDPSVRRVVVARRSGASNWTLEVVPAPAPPAKDLPPTDDVGKSLAMVALPAGLAVCAYDATHGDLLLAIRSTGQWQVSRVAGSDPMTGADLGDVGDPCALAVGPDGGPVVVYRDRGRAQVHIARAVSGVLTSSLVAGGEVAGPKGTQMHTLLGTALTAQVQSDGRALVAWFNGSTWSVGAALQQKSGGFAPLDLGLPPAERQLWPVLAADAAGVPWLSWVTLDAARGLAGARLVQRAVATQEAP